MAVRAQRDFTTAAGFEFEMKIREIIWKEEFVRKVSEAILPISARDMDSGERNYYAKQKESY